MISRQDETRPLGAVLQTAYLHGGHRDRDDNGDSDHDGGGQSRQDQPDDDPGECEAEITWLKQTDDPVSQPLAQPGGVQGKTEKQRRNQDPDRPRGIAVESDGIFYAGQRQEQQHDHAAN